METGDSMLVFDQAMVPTIETSASAKLRNKLIFANELANLWMTKQYTDVDLICTGNQIVRTHKLILAALSPFFRQIFLDVGPLLEVDYSISLDEVDAESIKSCLEKVYLGDQSEAFVDPALSHLSITGKALTEPVSTDTLQDVIQATIKTEPGLVCELADLVEDENLLFTPKKAKIWKHFTAKDKDHASCNVCQSTIKKKEGCTSGMIKHLTRFHPEVQDDNLAIPKDEPMDLDDSTYLPSLSPIHETEDHVVEKSSGGKSKKSKVWNFYDRIEKDIAKCKACDATIKTQKGNTTGMSRHLLRAHSDLSSQLEALREKDQFHSEEDDDDDDDFSPFKGISQKPKKRGPAKGSKRKAVTKKNKIWEYFDQQSDTNEARCNFCLITIKTEAGNVSGLTSHLRSSHPDLHEELNAEKGVDDKLASSAVRNSPVWEFYEELGANRVKCMKCNVILKYYYGTTSGLLRHLRRYHSDAYEKIKNEDGVTDLNETGTENRMAVTEVDNETIWKYFHRGIGIEETANCADCMAEIANEHGSLVTSCEEHLRASHTDLLEQYESQRKAFVHELIKKDKTAVKRRYTSRVVASAIWSFFRKTDDAALNQCSTCLLDIDCSQNTTAMVKHLEEAHPEQHEAFKKQSGIEAKDIKKPSAIWKHFQPTLDAKKHKCLACDKEILCHYQTTSNMIRHLEHNHTELYEVFLKESHGLEQSEDVNPLLKKPKKRNLNIKGSNDPVDRTCPDCGKEYSCRPAMLFHYKCVHSGIRPYKCEECGMTFARQDSWKSHTHSKVRSFLCSICGKTFARRNIRDTHERAHLNDRRYPCSFCGKKFMTNQQRTNHERTHTGEKPFQCTDCGRQFAQQHQLTTHTRIHTGEKPYSCKFCNQKFRHLSSRNNHKCDGKSVAGAVNVANQVPNAAASITVSWNN